MVKFFFSVHTITKKKQSNRQGGARAVDLPARSFDLACPGIAQPLGSLKGISFHTMDLKLCKISLFFFNELQHLFCLVSITKRVRDLESIPMLYIIIITIICQMKQI